MNLADIDILTLLPQRPPFVLVDKLLSCGDKDAVTSFVVREDCLLCDDGKLQSYGIMENIAQSCAARIGYLSLQKSGSVGIGVIGSVSDFEVLSLPPVGSQLETHITIDEEVFNFTLVSAKICDQVGNLIASSKMKISLLLP